ncbi:MAG: SpoIID/LytB domain-containing protein, partial [Planctomycetota bacterium]
CRREPERAAADDVGPGVGPDEAGPARVELPAFEPRVRVRVHRSRGRRGSVAIGADEQWIRVEPIEPEGAAIVLRGPVVVRLDDREGWSVEDHLGFRPPLRGTAPLELSSIDPRQPAVRMGETTFPGALRAVVRADDEGPGAFDVVNHVPLEAYLPGVLARELFGHWHPRTFMAQAVAARSFACAEHAYFTGRRHYDMTSTTRSQVYGGLVSSDRAVDAVAMTRGRVLAWEQGLVPGYYCSCCGGTPATAVDAIGSHPINRVPPLRGSGPETACRDAPVFSWKLVLDARRLAAGLARWGRRERIDGLAGLTGITAIEVTERNPHGRPIGHLVRGDGDLAVPLAAERLRRGVNAVTAEILPQGRPLRSSAFLVEVAGDEVTFAGNGFGHGVGLCQYGAEARARDGQEHDQIVEWYYPGAGIAQAYT